MTRGSCVQAWSMSLLVGAGIILLFSQRAVAGPSCGELLQKKCQSCHSLVRTCQELGRDKEGWQQSISQMALYAPAITSKEQKALVKCLTNQEKEVVELCPK